MYFNIHIFAIISMATSLTIPQPFGFKQRKRSPISSNLDFNMDYEQEAQNVATSSTPNSKSTTPENLSQLQTLASEQSNTPTEFDDSNVSFGNDLGTIKVTRPKQDLQPTEPNVAARTGRTNKVAKNLDFESNYIDPTTVMSITGTSELSQIDKSNPQKPKSIPQLEVNDESKQDSATQSETDSKDSKPSFVSEPAIIEESKANSVPELDVNDGDKQESTPNLTPELQANDNSKPDSTPEPEANDESKQDSSLQPTEINEESKKSDSPSEPQANDESEQDSATQSETDSKDSKPSLVSEPALIEESEANSVPELDMNDENKQDSPQSLAPEPHANDESKPDSVPNSSISGEIENSYNKSVENLPPNINSIDVQTQTEIYQVPDSQSITNANLDGDLETTSVRVHETQENNLTEKPPSSISDEIESSCHETAESSQTSLNCTQTNTPKESSSPDRPVLTDTKKESINIIPITSTINDNEQIKETTSPKSIDHTEPANIKINVANPTENEIQKNNEALAVTIDDAVFTSTTSLPLPTSQPQPHNANDDKNESTSDKITEETDESNGMASRITINSNIKLILPLVCLTLVSNNFQYYSGDMI